MARLEGTSPVEYFDSVDLVAVRGHAERLLRDNESTRGQLDRLLSRNRRVLKDVQVK